ncbi:hypothetical protein JOD54_004163 [Actinokineospora baliensis]|uniref:NRDE family protein n=1 Tax=Actinokineospora baliensis TaxID=547056 RepID=UPI001956B89A|nr:NRDE family protein [Actinokineospora baliensis]MBM7773959.1 hypothetical protein [Actinokineospora baliensis]
MFLRVRDPVVLLAAARDEFLDRPWAPPGRHWPDQDLLGGLDLVSGGTWLAVRTDRPAVSVLVNGPGTAPNAPSRGWLVPRALSGGEPYAAGMPGFHLLHAEPGRVRLTSWDGRALTARVVQQGDHVLTYGGLNDLTHSRVRRFHPRLAGLSDAQWPTLLDGPEPFPAKQDALLIDRIESGRPYGTTSAAAVSLDHHGLTYDFMAAPREGGSWHRVNTAPALDQGEQERTAG